MREKTTVEDLKKLRDELRVKMHLGSMEAKQWWLQIEPQFAELEASLTRGTEKAVESVGILVDELVAAFRRIHDRIENEEKL